VISHVTIPEPRRDHVELQYATRRYVKYGDAENRHFHCLARRRRLVERAEAHSETRDLFCGATRELFTSDQAQE
jgi:hypothetical protein